MFCKIPMMQKKISIPTYGISIHIGLFELCAILAYDHIIGVGLL